MSPCQGWFKSSPAWSAYATQNLLGVASQQHPRRTAVICCSSKQQPQQQRRYTLPPVYLNRSDLAWGTPPWRFHQTCFVEDLELHRHVPTLTGAAGAEDVVVKFLVDSPSHGARGLWLKGSVEARLMLSCEWCNEVFVEEVAARFSVWLNGEADDDTEVTSAEELAFPEGQETCDLSPAVVDAISLALPTVCLCGGKHCNKYRSQPAQWASLTLPQAGKGASPFAALLGAQSKGRAKGAAKSK